MRKGSRNLHLIVESWQRLERASVLALVGALSACTASIDQPPSGSGATGSGATGSGATGTGGAGGSGTGGAGAQGGASGSAGATAATGGGGATGGTAGATGGTGAVPDPACVGAAADTDASYLRRLTVLEYQLTVQSLFQLADPPDVEGIPSDNERFGFKTFAEIQTTGTADLRGYLAKAGELADALLADATRRTAVLGCQPDAAGCLASFLTTFGRLAYRRPLEQTEIDAITADATTHGTDAADQIRFAIEVLLSSPSFLYRVEIGTSPEGLSTLTSAEVASRLSFALLGRSPSAALLDQAAAGALDTPEGLRTTAQAMLADPAAQTFFAAFFRQWLGFGTLRAPVVPPTDWTEALMPAMQAETDGVIKDYAWGGQSLLDMLTASYTRTSAGLATYYDLSAPTADGRVEIPAGHARAGSGLLTHGSLLSAKSDGDLIAIRGNWLRRTFLCDEVEPLPNLAEEIGDDLVGLDRIEIVNLRNTRPQCNGCHAMIDPIGIGFVQFDSTGRFDSTIDASGYNVMPGLPDAAVPAFMTIGELSEKLKALPVVPHCVAERAFLYVNGREPAAADACTLEGISQAFATSGNSFPALLAGIVEAPAFRLRRALPEVPAP